MMSYWFWRAFGLVLESDMVLAPIWIWIWIGEGSPLLYDAIMSSCQLK